MEKSLWITLVVIALVLIAGFFVIKSYNPLSNFNDDSEILINKGVPPGSNFYDVVIQDLSFEPSNLTININDTVTWTNNDNEEHTVTSDSEELSSLPLMKGDAYIHTFMTPGTYEYYCTLHSSMKGTIIVA